MSEVALLKVTEAAGTAPNSTVAPLTKSVPVKVTAVPPAVGPLVGRIDFRVRRRGAAVRGDREVGVRDVEEDVAHAGDADARLGRRRVGDGHGLACRRWRVEAASVVGKVLPPSVESSIATLAQLTGAAVVPATFQVTVCALLPAQVTAVFGWVTANGPGRGVHRHRGRGVVDPAAAGAVVAGGQAEGHGAVAVRHRLAQGRDVAEDVREAREGAARHRQRHERAEDRPHRSGVGVGRRGACRGRTPPTCRSGRRRPDRWPSR